MWLETDPPNYRVIEFPNGDKSFVHVSAQCDNTTIWRFTYINSSCVLGGKYPILIGGFCSLASGVYIWTYEGHETRFPTTFPLKAMIGVELGYEEVIELPQGVKIGNDVWIGHQVRVMAGVSIATGCVIGARAVVTRNCEPYGIYAGVPAKLIRKRFSDRIIAELLQLAWWDWPLDRLRRNAPFFSTDLTQFSGDVASLTVL